MSIPTPSAIGQRLTERKQRELQREAEQKALAEKLDKSLKTAEDKKHRRTVAKNGWNRKKSTSSTSSESAKSASSEKGPAPRGTSSKSAESRPNAVSRSSVFRTSTKGSPSSKPTPSSPTSAPSQPKNGEAGKKPFVRKPHLTQRLSDNEALKELRDSMPQVRHPQRSSKGSSKRGTQHVKRTGGNTKSSSKQK